MPSSPPTPTQLQAHRFALRRLESALVGRDPTLRRDPGRRQQRALATGAIIGVLVLVGFAVVGLVRGDADWRDAAIVRGTPSGALYAVAHDPDRLVPALNLASARLLAAVVSPREVADGAPPVVVVRDDALAAAPRTAPAGIVGAPAVLPDPTTTPAGVWAVCDVALLDPARPDPTVTPRLTSVVLGGVAGTGRVLSRDEALLLQEDATTFWLVAEGRRARIDARAGAVRRGLGIDSRPFPRPASSALVSALPEAPPLVAPEVAGIGGPPADPATAALGVPVGGVVDAGDGRFFLVGLGGVQEVPAVVAQIVRFANPDRGADPRIAAIPAARLDVLPDVAVVDTGAYPTSFPRVVGYGVDAEGRRGPPGGTVACVRPGVGAGAPAVVTVSEAVPPTTPLPVATTGGTPMGGAHVRGAGAYVTPVVLGREPDRSRGLLVDPGGRAYAVPDEQAAAALGLGRPTPVPASVLDLLPRGPELDPESALTMR